MAQVSIIQHVEISTGSGQPLRIGSKVIPSTITLTGTGEVFHRVFNDVPATTVTDLYSDDLTGIKFFGVKCSVEALFGFSNTSESGSTNLVHLEPNMWQFFGEGTTTSSISTLGTRCAEAEVAVELMKIYIPGAAVGDVELIVAY